MTSIILFTTYITKELKMLKNVLVCVKTQFFGKDEIHFIEIDMQKMMDDNNEGFYSQIHNYLEKIDESHCMCSFNESQNHCDCNCGNWSGEWEVISTHQDTELKDINDKPIYADSSICKIEWRDNRYSNLKREFGYFSHNKEKHCLEFIITIDTLPIKRINFIQHIDFIVSLEIIDTKQKNKLGLIKDESWAK